VDQLWGTLTILAGAGFLALLVHAVRSNRIPDRWMSWLTVGCAVLWILLLVTEWPFEAMTEYWRDHSIIAGTVSSVLLVAVGFLVYERSEQRKQDEMQLGLSGAGAGGIVDHMVDVEVALGLLSVGKAPNEVTPHWEGWDAPGKPLKWLRNGRQEILAWNAPGDVVDPRRVPVDPDQDWEKWASGLVDQALRRVIAAMRDWSPLIGSSKKGMHALLALSGIRRDLMAIYDLLDGDPTEKSKVKAWRKVADVRARVRVLAHYFEKWSGAPRLRPEVLKDGKPLTTMAGAPRLSYGRIDRELGDELTRRARKMGFEVAERPSAWRRLVRA